METFELVQTTITYLLITVTGIIVIVNPLTTAFLFMSMTTDITDAERKTIASKAIKVSTSIFFVFALLGGIIFQLFGITLAAFRIAGGIILFGIAMGMISKRENDGDKDVKKTATGEIA